MSVIVVNLNRFIVVNLNRSIVVNLNRFIFPSIGLCILLLQLVFLTPWTDECSHHLAFASSDVMHRVAVASASIDDMHRIAADAMQVCVRASSCFACVVFVCVDTHSCHCSLQAQ